MFHYSMIALIALFAAVVTAIAWLILRRATETTKGAWSMSIAIGYAVGHAGLIALGNLPADTVSADAAMALLELLPAGFLGILMPQSQLDCLPLAVLLAGVVSANSALFEQHKPITIAGAVLISCWLVLQLVGGFGSITVDSTIRLLAGIVALVLCWLSLQASIQGKSRKIWMGCVAILSVTAVSVLAITGQTTLAALGAILLAAMTGGLLASLLRSAGTDNIRYSGAVISCSSIGLLLVACWISSMPWYPVAILVIGYVAVNSWLPEFIRAPKQRISITVGCSIVALAVSLLVRFGVIA